MREWTLALPRELPLWELKVLVNSQFLENDYKGQNSMDWGILYIIRKLLERRCLKWTCMTHLDIWNISYGQKKGLVSNWQFDSWPLKVDNHPDFLACKWHTTYCWKALNEGYNFASDLISIGNLHAKLWAPKITGVLVVRISGFPLGNPKTKCHLDVGFVERHRIYYKGEGGGFPQVRAMMNLVSPSCPWLVLTPKVLQLCTNHLVFGFV